WGVGCAGRGGEKGAMGQSFEDSHYGAGVAGGTVTAVVAAKAVVRSREQSDVLPSFVAGKRRDALDGCFGDDRQISSEPFEVRHRPFPHVDQRGARRTRPFLER